MMMLIYIIQKKIKNNPKNKYNNKLGKFEEKKA